MSEYLTAADVARRYGLRDLRAARRLMDAAGAFVVGRRLLISAADLARHEDALRAERRARANGEARRPERRPRRRPPRQDLSNLPPDFDLEG